MAKQVVGLTSVLKNLNCEIEGIKNRSKKGLVKAGALVRREGEIITPVDTGNLINSWYGPTVTEKWSGEIYAEIGLTAAYAPIVHEMIDAEQALYDMYYGEQGSVYQKGGVIFKKPEAQPKFLETPLKENAGKILQIIRRNAKVKR